MCVQGSQKIGKKEFPAARIKQQHIRLAKIEESESVAAVVALCPLDFLDNETPEDRTTREEVEKEEAGLHRLKRPSRQVVVGRRRKVVMWRRRKVVVWRRRKVVVGRRRKVVVGRRRKVVVGRRRKVVVGRRRKVVV